MFTMYDLHDFVNRKSNSENIDVTFGEDGRIWVNAQRASKRVTDYLMTSPLMRRSWSSQLRSSMTLNNRTGKDLPAWGLLGAKGLSANWNRRGTIGDRPDAPARAHRVVARTRPRSPVANPILAVASPTAGIFLTGLAPVLMLGLR